MSGGSSAGDSGLGARREPAWQGALRVIEAAYRAEPEESTWLTGITDAAAQLGNRPYAYTLDITPGAPQILALTGDPELSVQLGQAAMFAINAVPIELIRAYHSIDPQVDTSAERARRLAERRNLDANWLQTACEGHYPIDSLGMIAADPEGPHVLLLAFHEIGTRVPARLEQPLSLLSAHLSSALRLRRALTSVVDAVLSPDGRVLDATAGSAAAENAEVRLSLSEAALRMDRARLRDTSPEEAVELWNAMVEGEWTVVETVDRDGKRLMMARRNRPNIHPMAELTSTESQVATYAAHGHTYKLIAYELGMPASTVAAHLTRAIKKLGFSSRTEWLASRGG